MKSFNVQLSSETQNDLKIILDYYRFQLERPDIAYKQYILISQEISKLDQMPERHRVFIPKWRSGYDLHRMNVNNFAVFYIIIESSVIITNILFSSSDIDSKLSL